MKMHHYNNYDIYMYRLLKFLTRIEFIHTDTKLMQDAIHVFILLKFRNFSQHANYVMDNDDKLARYHNDFDIVSRNFLKCLEMEYAPENHHYIYDLCMRCLCYRKPLKYEIRGVVRQSSQINDWADLVSSSLNISGIHNPSDIRAAANEVMKCINFRDEHFKLQRICKRFIQQHIWGMVNKNAQCLGSFYHYDEKFLDVMNIIMSLPLPNYLKRYITRKEFSIPLYIIFEICCSKKDDIVLTKLATYYRNKYNNPFFV